MKKINTSAIVTGLLIKIYITVSRAWATSHLAIKAVKMSAIRKTITPVKPSVTEAV